MQSFICYSAVWSAMSKGRTFPGVGDHLHLSLRSSVVNSFSIDFLKTTLKPLPFGSITKKTGSLFRHLSSSSLSTNSLGNVRYLPFSRYILDSIIILYHQLLISVYAYICLVIACNDAAYIRKILFLLRKIKFTSSTNGVESI